jgi:glycosyltransferase involved in cell wall biosynthesis
MRILFATDFYPPFLGGVEVQTALLAEQLASRGHAVTVATVWHKGLPTAESAGGVSIRRLNGMAIRLPWAFSDPARRRYHPPFPDPVIARGLQRLVRETRADIVHAAGWIAYSARIAAGSSSTPFVLSARDFGYSCPIRTLVLKGALCSGPGATKCLAHAREVYGAPKGVAATSVLTLRPWLVSGVARVHVASQFAADIARRDLLRSDDPRVTVIPNMIEAPRMQTPASEASQWLARLPEDPFILFVGSLQRHKGIGPLLEAYAQLRVAPPLVLVGTTWPNTPASWPAGVTTLFDVPNDVVREIWNRSLFGVAPSLVPETFGNVVLEAMFSGRAIIASSIGGPLDIVDPAETGFLTAPGDVAGLMRAMQTLVDDPALRDRMGSQARNRVTERFSPEAVVPKFEAMYAAAAGQTVADQD